MRNVDNGADADGPTGDEAAFAITAGVLAELNDWDFPIADVIRAANTRPDGTVGDEL